MANSKKKKKRKKSFWLFSISFRIILIICAIAIYLSYLSALVNPAKISFISLFGLYFAPILFINISLLVIAIFKRSKSFWIPLISILPSFFFIGSLIQVHSKSQESIAKPITLMTYNVGRFKSGKEKMDNKLCIDNIINSINNENPEIVCLQEFEIKDTNNIKKLFSKYPYHKKHLFKLRNNRFFGNITLSKFPIKNGGRTIFPHSTNMALYCDIVINKQLTRIYNCHLESYNISPTRLIKNIGNPNNKISDELIAVHGKVKNTNARRTEQVNIILEHLHKTELPSIFCGDFNDTPLSYTYTSLVKNHKDTFKEAGKGFGASYSTLWPMLRIDYILCPKNSIVLGHKTLKNIKYSDHYPVISKFTI